MVLSYDFWNYSYVWDPSEFGQELLEKLIDKATQKILSALSQFGTISFLGCSCWCVFRVHGVHNVAEKFVEPRDHVLFARLYNKHQRCQKILKASVGIFVMAKNLMYVSNITHNNHRGGQGHIDSFVDLNRVG